MKKLFVTIAAVVLYLLISISTGWWHITWIIWIFYSVYMIAQAVKDQDK